MKPEVHLTSHRPRATVSITWLLSLAATQPHGTQLVDIQAVKRATEKSRAYGAAWKQAHKPKSSPIAKKNGASMQ